MRHRASLLSKVLGLCTTLGMTSCGEHVVVVELSNLASNTTTVSAYYRIESDAYHASSLTSSQFPVGNPAFGIRPPEGRSGTMTVQVFAYKNNAPCELSKGSTSVDVSGSGKLSATAALDAGAAAPGCSANDAPVKYPSDAKVWAAAANNVWIVGKDAAVLHWNGSLFKEISVPSSVLNGKTPTWNAVHGDSQGNVWLASDADAVVRIDQSGTYSGFTLNFGSSTKNGIVWTGVYASGGQAILSATTTADGNGYIGTVGVGQNVISVTQTTQAPISLPAVASYGLHSIGCSSLDDCWFGGNQSVIVHYTKAAGYKTTLLASGSSCTSQNSSVRVSAIYANAAVAKVKMLGHTSDGSDLGSRAGVFLTYAPAAAPNPDCFWSSDQDSSSMYVPGPLLGISGTSPDDLVVVGTDAMYRWKTSTPVPIPGIDKTSWQSVSAVPGGFFAVSQRSMTDPMGRVYYADLGP